MKEIIKMELINHIESMDTYQLQLVLSFIKTLFDLSD